MTFPLVGKKLISCSQWVTGSKIPLLPARDFWAISLAGRGIKKFGSPIMKFQIKLKSPSSFLLGFSTYLLPSTHVREYTPQLAIAQCQLWWGISTMASIAAALFFWMHLIGVLEASLWPVRCTEISSEEVCKRRSWKKGFQNTTLHGWLSRSWKILIR